MAQDSMMVIPSWRGFVTLSFIYKVQTTFAIRQLQINVVNIPFVTVYLRSKRRNLQFQKQLEILDTEKRYYLTKKHNLSQAAGSQKLTTMVN